ncbi:hypothetical protein WJX72_012426 [[Myrmecia] bisecta]|uniref:Amino acid transporter transmembrane domain-containing protein n=1 Tax=[Myrmecia] bisecta TaxID=41462 RepID=A0AAW1QTT1_9CHLO
MAGVMAAGGEVMFTRGGLDAPDTRGESMVQKHLEKLQKEKEVAALAKLRDTLPLMSPAVCILALQEAAWDDSRALLLLQLFQQARGEQLQMLEQKRAELEAAAAKERAASGSEASSSGSDTASGSDSDSDNGRHRKRSRRKESGSKRKARKSDQSRSKKRSKDKSSRTKKKRSKDSKKAQRKDEAKGPLTQQFGKYGLIRETDMYAKRAEFLMWATEYKKVDVELLPKAEEKDLFRSYMEDFNTGTLPHKKYYNLDVYEAQQAAKAAKKGRPVETEKTLFNDEEERKRELAAERASEAEERLREAYNQLKYTQHGKAADMREQELMRIQMNLAYRTVAWRHPAATKKSQGETRASLLPEPLTSDREFIVDGRQSSLTHREGPDDMPHSVSNSRLMASIVPPLLLGILGNSVLPPGYAFAMTGVVAGFAITGVVAAANMYTSDLLLWQSYWTRKKEFSSISRAVGGRPWQVATELSIIGLQMGTIISTTLLCGGAAQSALTFLWGSRVPHWINNDGRTLMCLITILMVWPLCMVKQMRSHEKAGDIGVLIVVVLIIATVVASVEAGLPALGKAGEFAIIGFSSLPGLAAAVAIFGFGFYIQPMMMPLVKEVPEGKRGIKVVGWAAKTVITAAFIVYGISGFFAAARFGSQTSSNLLENDLGGGVAQGLLNLAMAFYLAMSIPPNEVPTRQAIDQWVGPLCSYRWPAARHFFETGFIMGINLLISLLFPTKVATVLTVVGATATAMVAYVIPITNHFLLLAGKARCQRRVDSLGFTLPSSHGRAACTGAEDAELGAEAASVSAGDIDATLTPAPSGSLGRTDSSAPALPAAAIDSAAEGGADAVADGDAGKAAEKVAPPKKVSAAQKKAMLRASDSASSRLRLLLRPKGSKEDRSSGKLSDAEAQASQALVKAVLPSEYRGADRWTVKLVVTKLAAPALVLVLGIACSVIALLSVAAVIPQPEIANGR